MFLSVRLGPEEVAAVRGLRRARVNVSALVRQALRSAAPASRRRPRPAEVVKDILAETEQPSGPVRRPPLDDRRAMAAFLRQKLARK